MPANNMTATMAAMKNGISGFFLTSNLLRLESRYARYDGVD
jgi:hypothetical protein